METSEQPKPLDTAQEELNPIKGSSSRKRKSPDANELDPWTKLQPAKIAGPMNGLNPWTPMKLGAKNKIKVYRFGRAVRYDPLEIRELMRKEGEKMPVATRPRIPTRRNTKRSANKSVTAVDPDAAVAAEPTN